MVRTRIAPSPTGYPHIGTIYQALFDYAFAKKNSGKFIIRIEDTDRERFIADAEEKLFEAIDWFNLTEDESPRKGGEFPPYRQSERLAIYHKYAQELLDKGHAYFAYYPKEESGKKEYTGQRETIQIKEDQSPQPSQPTTISEMISRGDWVLRMKVPQNQTIVVHDGVRGDITFESNQVTEQVLIKSDGFPTYHFAVVVDDHLMKITHIVRGEEWISSAPKHVLLFDYFGWEMPLLFHTPLLRNPDKSKLSKRHSHTNVSWYQNEGFLSEAILNFLALMGWSHPKEIEIFSLDEFITLFDLKDIKPVGPIFDLVKLQWMNQQHLQMKSDEELKKLIIDFYPKAKELPEETFNALIPLVKTRMQTLKDFEQQTEIFFDGKSGASENKELAQDVAKELVVISEWKHDMIFQAMKKIMDEKKIRMPILYKLFTGKERGLPLPEVLEIVGREKALSLLSQ